MTNIAEQSVNVTIKILNTSCSECGSIVGFTGVKSMGLNSDSKIINTYEHICTNRKCGEIVELNRKYPRVGYFKDEKEILSIYCTGND